MMSSKAIISRFSIEKKSIEFTCVCFELIATFNAGNTAVPRLELSLE